jgi:hypothetical protein
MTAQLAAFFLQPCKPMGTPLQSIWRRFESERLAPSRGSHEVDLLLEVSTVPLRVPERCELW